MVCLGKERRKTRDGNYDEAEGVTGGGTRDEFDEGITMP